MSGEGDSLEITVNPDEEFDGNNEGTPEETGGYDESQLMDALNALIGNEEDLEYEDEGEYDDTEEDYEDDGAYAEDEPSEVDLLRQQIADLQSTQITNSVYDKVGGQQQYEQMIEWAANNLSDQEQNFYDQVMASNDAGAIQFAVNSLQGRFTAAFDQQGTLNFNNTGASSVEGFGSMAELADALDNPRYQTDEAYRDLVERKAAISNIGMF